MINKNQQFSDRLLAAVLIFVFYRRLMPPPAPPFEHMEIARLTDSGKASAAAISPDGKYVVHAVTEEGKSSLWIRHAATGSNVQILPPAEGAFSTVTFSRDGNSLYYEFGKEGLSSRSLYAMPVLGGNPRKLIELELTSLCSFSPDEKRFALTKRKGNESFLLTVKIDGSDERQLATRKFPEKIQGAAWSPDGKTIAYAVISYRGGYSYSLEAVSAEGGQARRIGSRTWYYISGFQWLPHSHGLIILAGDQETSSQVWHVSYPEGEARRITNDLNNYSSLSLNGDASALVAVQQETIAHIWVVPVGNPTSALQITKGRQDGTNGLAWTSDGKIIFDAPDSSQNGQLWVTAIDGSSPRQLTAEGRLNATPAVCGDGRHLVYFSYRAGTPHIWRSNLDGSDAKQLTNGEGEFMPSCSPDGTWLTYGTADPKAEGVWRMPIEGGKPVRIWEQYDSSQISPDGKQVLIWRNRSNLKAYIIPAVGGQPVKTFTQDSELGLPRQWTADGRSLLYLKTKRGVSNVWQKPLAGGEAKQLTQFGSNQIGPLIEVAMSRDGKQLAVARSSTTSDVVLIKDLNIR